MFSVRKSADMAKGYFPDMRLVYERIMKETRAVLNNLERRFVTFTQQQFTFVKALDRCRQTAFEPTAKIINIAQVSHYADHVSDNSTDKRICNIFLSLVRDFGEFRRTLIKLTKHRDEKLFQIYEEWKKILERRKNISNLRVQFPYTHLNHLSCDESRNYVGGIISLLPIVMEYAKQAVARIEVVRAYRPYSGPLDHICHAYGERTGTTPQSIRPLARPHGAQTNRPIPTQYCKHAQIITPVLSSPPTTTSSSEVTLRSVDSATALNVNKKKHLCRACRPASAEVYSKKTVVPKKKGKDDCCLLNVRPGVATQTPKYFNASLKPVLAWTDQEVSELMLRKMLRDHKRTEVRPTWKP